MVQRHVRIGAVLFLAAGAFTACGGSLGGLTARASDEWARTYPLAAGGEVQVSTVNGSIEVEGVEGAMVDVRAERTLDPMGEQTPRRVRGRLNGGGTPIELSTTNGPIRVAVR